jgi:uncharacterized repeat protein (TIGR02543 family)
MKMKRIISLALCFLLMFTLCQLVLAEGGTVHNVNDQTTLTNALAAAQTGDTIKLTADITYTSTIVIENKSVTFNLNGYTLNVVNNAEEDTAEEMSGLYVKGNAAVALEGDGEFNVTGSWYGVFAECNEGESAEVTITNATGIGRDGVAAQHSKVTVKGDATSSGSTYSGVWASYENAEVIVEGNVYANGEMSMGVNTDTLASVTVKGSVIVSGSGSMGIKASDDGEAIVENDITASGTGSIGIDTMHSNITAYGNVTGDYGGINAFGSNVDITGGVRTLGSEVNNYGVSATKFSRINVEGDVRSNEKGAVIWAEDNETPSTIAIRGVIEAPKYVQIGIKTLDFTDGRHTTSIDGCYIIYEDPDNLYVGAVGVAEYAGGSGSVEDPYLVVHADQLYNVRNHLDKHFRQIANLDLSGYRSGSGWAPIGTSTDRFIGTYDGDGHIIDNLFIKQVGVWNNRIPAGLFGYTGAEAEICNLALKSVDVTGCYYVGSLVGNNSGGITNVIGTGSVTGEWDTGGLVGRNNGSLIGSCFMGDVTGTAIIEYGEWTGGLVGYNLGAITNCWATATVVSEGDNVGGLVGENLTEGIITESYSSGDVTAGDYTGGLVGSNSGEITACYSICTVSGDRDVGGLVGNGDDETVTGCYWDKDTSGQSTSAGGTGKTTVEMKQQMTYAGWDFDTIWGIEAGKNNGYPFLKWQGYEAEPTAPSAPQNFTATPGDGQVELRWSAPASNGGAAISRYEVSGDNGGTWVTAATNTSHTFTGLTNGTAYTFKVRAVNSAGSGAEASAAATPTAAPATAYTVTVNGSYAGTSGAGQYSPGAQVSIHAGSRSNYSFTGWTSPDGVPFANANNATTTFIMPAKDVTITANWSYNGGGGSGRGSSTPTTPAAPAAPAYKADVKAGSGAEMTLPVTVDKDVGTASVDAGSQGLDQGGTIITIPSIPDVDTYSVGIPVPDLSTSDVQGTLTVNTDAGNITVSSNMLTGVLGISGSKAEIAIGQGDKDNLPDTVKAAIGDRPLVQLTLSIDGVRTDWSNSNAPVTVSIPYTPTAAELANPESIVVWYIDGSGNVVTIPNGHYDPATETVTFDTTHFSDYAVAYNKVSFNDVTADVWYHKAVSFIAARGITGGTGNGNYSPEAKLTRGQFIVMLMKAYGIAPDADPKNNFADAGATYYTGYLAAAKRLGISAGIGNNMFAPEKEITRQEMFTLLYNALKVIGQLPQGDSDKTLDHFSDAGQIDSWAKEAMTLLVKTGTIGGNAGKLNPTSTTTRAEMAQVLYNLLSK